MRLGRAMSSPCADRVTTNRPLWVSNSTLSSWGSKWFNTTWAEANVACPQRSISKSGVNHRKA